MRRQDYETFGYATASAVNKVAPRLRAGDEEAILESICQELWLENPGWDEASFRKAYNAGRDQEVKTA